MNIIEKLKKEKTKWENRIYGVGETRIDLMIEDVIRELQKYQNELEKKENIIKALVDYLIEGLQTKSYEEKICMEDILNKIENLGYEFENPCNMRNMFKNVTKLEKIEWKNKVEREGK